MVIRKITRPRHRLKTVEDKKKEKSPAHAIGSKQSKTGKSTNHPPRHNLRASENTKTGKSPAPAIDSKQFKTGKTTNHPPDFLLHNYIQPVSLLHKHKSHNGLNGIKHTYNKEHPYNWKISEMCQ